MISNKCQYALKALLELAKREGSGPATIVDIAAAQAIPPRFLEAILREMKQAGFTESIRGKKGGYALAMPAHRITVGAVVRLMEGPFFLEADADPDVFQPVWQKANEALNIIFDGTHFADLAQRARQAAGPDFLDYSI